MLLEVEDSGTGFNPAEVDRREVEPNDVSGRGLQIIRALMTSVRVQSPTETGGTRLCMERVLRDGKPPLRHFSPGPTAYAQTQ